MAGSMHATPPEERIHETEFRFCSHCQKNQPSAQFYGVNRNKGTKNNRYEYLKTCEPCRNKPSQRRSIQFPVAEKNIIHTPRIRKSTTPGEKVLDMSADRTRRAMRPQRNSSPPGGELPSPHPIPPSVDSPARSVSTQDAIAVSSPALNRKRAGSPELGEPKRRTLNPRDVNGNREYVTTTPKPSPNNNIAPPSLIEIEETPSPGPQPQELQSPHYLESYGSPAPSERLVGQGLMDFALSLGNLSRLLKMAAEELDDDAIEGLEDEINHDWRVQEMTTFVEGYFKGASKRKRRYN